MATIPDAACTACGGRMPGVALRSVPPSYRFRCRKCKETMIVVRGEPYTPYDISKTPAPQHKTSNF